MNFTNLKQFQLFNMGDSLPAQEVDVFRGLIYSSNFEELLAIPTNYSVDVYSYRGSPLENVRRSSILTLHQNCYGIRPNAFNDGTLETTYNKPIDRLYGENVGLLNEYSLAFLDVKEIMFPNLNDVREFAFTQSKVTTLFLPATLTKFADTAVEGCEDLNIINLGYGFNCDLVLVGANNINGELFGKQFYKLLPQDKDFPKTITVMQGVYDFIIPEDIDYANSINWNINSL